MDFEVANVFYDHKVMPVSLVVPEKEIFTMGGFNFIPVFKRFIDGWQRRVLVNIVGDSEAFQRFQNGVFLCFHVTKINEPGES